MDRLTGSLSLSANRTDVAKEDRLQTKQEMKFLPKAETVEIPAEIQEELTNLRGVRDLVGERWGYFMGRRLKQTEMNEATKTERKAANEISKSIKDNLEKFIKDADIDGYKEQIKKLADARKVVAEKSKPFREEIKPLAKAQKYLDTIAIPDALKEIGHPITPRFNLSNWIKKTLEEQKN